MHNNLLWVTQKSISNNNASPVVDYLYGAVLFDPEFAQYHVVYTAKRVGPCVGLFVPGEGRGGVEDERSGEYKEAFSQGKTSNMS